ncbi:hypothetical protein [Xanthomonas sp. 10-10]|uniref:Uncharacterized protein n=1 Tax=Xanthomonas sp. 10-10 TaxID=3115848 RepID=A0AAU7P3T2_9XANT
MELSRGTAAPKQRLLTVDLEFKVRVTPREGWKIGAFNLEAVSDSVPSWDIRVAFNYPDNITMTEFWLALGAEYSGRTKLSISVAHGFLTVVNVPVH